MIKDYVYDKMQYVNQVSILSDKYFNMCDKVIARNGDYYAQQFIT